MENTSEKVDFQIVLESEEVDKSSVYWQRQCQTLYNTIRKNLSEGSVSPSNRKGGEGEKTDIIISFDVLTLTGITLNSFYILIKLINIWERNRKRSNLKYKFRNGSEVICTNLDVDDVPEIYRRLKQEDNKQE